MAVASHQGANRCRAKRQREEPKNEWIGEFNHQDLQKVNCCEADERITLEAVNTTKKVRSADKYEGASKFEIEMQNYCLTYS